MAKEMEKFAGQINQITSYFASKTNFLILLFTLAYVAAFTARGIASANYEFLYYTVLMVVSIVLILALIKQLHLATFIILNLSLWGFLHLLGGNLHLGGGIRLYDFYIIPGWFRYDNFVHTYGSFITTLALYSLLADFTHEQIRKRYWLLSLILILMACGLGTLVELTELIAALYLNAAQQVGDYYNNAFDLFFNLVGAILAAIIIYYYLERPKFIQKISGQNGKIVCE